MKIKMIAAHDINLGIGYKNKLLWNIPEDLKHFKDETKNKVVVMGSNTYYSIGKPLPFRTNAVLTSKKYLNQEFNKPEIMNINIPKLLGSDKHKDDSYYENRIFSDIHSLLDFYKDEEEIIIIGGESIYQQFLPFADELIITVVLDMFKADTHFPFYIEDFKETERTEILSSKSGLDYFIAYFKKKSYNTF